MSIISILVRRKSNGKGKKDKINISL